MAAGTGQFAAVGFSYGGPTKPAGGGAAGEGESSDDDDSSDGDDDEDRSGGEDGDGAAGAAALKPVSEEEAAQSLFGIPHFTRLLRIDARTADAEAFLRNVQTAQYRRSERKKKRLPARQLNDPNFRPPPGHEVQSVAASAQPSRRSAYGGEAGFCYRSGRPPAASTAALAASYLAAAMAGARVAQGPFIFSGRPHDTEWPCLWPPVAGGVLAAAAAARAHQAAAGASGHAPYYERRSSPSYRPYERRRSRSRSRSRSPGGHWAAKESRGRSPTKQFIVSEGGEGGRGGSKARPKRIWMSPVYVCENPLFFPAPL